MFEFKADVLFICILAGICYLSSISEARIFSGCRPNFYMSSVNHNECEPCDCDPVFALNANCNRFTGQCECKVMAFGQRCEIYHKALIGSKHARSKRRSSKEAPAVPDSWTPCVRNCETKNPSQKDKCRAICGHMASRWS